MNETSVRLYMLYKLAHVLRDKFPWLWMVMGVGLSWLFTWRYGRKMKDIPAILEKFSGQTPHGFIFEQLSRENVPALARMLSEQPDEAFKYFRPHGFSENDLQPLVRDKGFLAFLVKSGDDVVGYFFQRSFFWGKAYRGYITDYRWRRKGINRMMNLCAAEISTMMGLRVFGTIAPENMASLTSAQSANEVKIIRTLDNGDYYVEYLPK